MNEKPEISQSFVFLQTTGCVSTIFFINQKCKKYPLYAYLLHKPKVYFFLFNEL